MLDSELGRVDRKPAFFTHEGAEKARLFCSILEINFPYFVFVFL